MAASLRVGITGGIGSGKSALTDRLARRGVVIVDADVVARRVVEPGTPALAAIAGHFGAQVLQDDGTLDRAALRAIVFNAPEERRWLESLTHPLIGAQLAADLDAAASPYVVLSSPLLLEGSQRDLVDHVVVVDVPETLQVERASARDSNAPELVRKIMAAQLPREKRLALADTVIDNSGDLAALEQQAEDLHHRLLELARQHAQAG
ncbi:MAG: dephospho-CoA kinase [Halieaceae bacterium]|jgi:dephospho-CoA kinase|nr:dephospho-CoA kinase [Halieaceae bacterium]